MRYSLSNNTWGEEELAAISNVIQTDRYSMGEFVAKAEHALAEKVGSAHAVMVSSGSAANLLAVASMMYSGRLHKGDEILVPAVSWSTTYFPLEQMGLKTRLVDIDPHTLNMDLGKLEAAITDRTKGVFAVNLLGNPNDFDVLAALCQKHHLILMEDNCESMGATYHGKAAGTFGVFGTFSTFYSHHLCTMEGGFAVTDDEELYEYMLAVRAHGWTRNLPSKSKLHQKSENEFYESFCFVVPGFNLRPLEMEGAIGVEQIKKLDGFIAQRRKNAAYFQSKMAKFNQFAIQKETGESSWFGFAIILKPEYSGQRDAVVQAIRDAEIEVRPIVAGNFARQPVFKYMDATMADELAGANYIHDNGFFVGNHSQEMKGDIDYLCKVLEQYGTER